MSRGWGWIATPEKQKRLPVGCLFLDAIGCRGCRRYFSRLGSLGWVPLVGSPLRCFMWKLGWIIGRTYRRSHSLHRLLTSITHVSLFIDLSVGRSLFATQSGNFFGVLDDDSGDEKPMTKTKGGNSKQTTATAGTAAVAAPKKATGAPVDKDRYVDLSLSLYIYIYNLLIDTPHVCVCVCVCCCCCCLARERGKRVAHFSSMCWV